MQLPRLGKTAPRIDSRTFKLSKYLGPALPAPPAEVSWISKVHTWPMYLNDTLKDCLIAAEAHMINQWSRYGKGKEMLPSDQDVLTVYERVGGYVPGDPTTDNGADSLTALKDWRANGLGGHKVLAYMSVDQSNLTEVFQAIALFGNLFTGLQLPASAQGASTWTVPPGGPVGNGTPGSWGGHMVPIDAAAPGGFTCVTWGQPLEMSRGFFQDYVDEAWVVLSPLWIGANGLAPSQFKLAQLQADLAAL